MGDIILLSDYRGHSTANVFPPYDEAEARAAELAMKEFDEIAADLDEERLEEYMLREPDSKHTG